MPIIARTAGLCHAAFGSTCPAVFMNRVAHVAPAVISHSNDSAGMVTCRRQGADHASLISVSIASDADTPKKRVHACLGGTSA